jgi:hypothetical protein
VTVEHARPQRQVAQTQIVSERPKQESTSSSLIYQPANYDHCNHQYY